METTTITMPNPGEYEKKGTVLEREATALVIRDSESYETAAEFLLRVQESRKRIEAEINPPKEKAYDLWKSLGNLCNKVLGPFNRAEQTVKQKIGKYDFDQREKRRIEAERLAADARKKAEAERQKQISKARKQGDIEGAKNLEHAPLAPVAPAPKTPEPHKVTGVAVRYEWDFTIADENKVPREYLMVDTSKIRKVVKALGKNTVIAGVTVFERPVTTGRG